MSWEILRFALRGLAADKLRSGLTTLGVMIGVGAVILLVAVGNGSSLQIQENIARLGSNTLTIRPSTSGGGGFGGPGGGMRMPGGGGGQRQSQDTGPRIQAKDLTVEDAEALADAPSVKSASPVVTVQSATAAYEGGSHAISSFVGSDPAYFETSDSEVARGAAFTEADVDQARKVVVIGTTVAEELFGTVDPIGRRLAVNGVPFTIVGVLREKGSSGLQDSDDLAIAPLTSVRQSLTGFGGLDRIVAAAKDAESTDTAEAEIAQILDQRHGIGVGSTADYSIQNQAGLQETVSESSRTFTVLLGAVAAISLLVGGIGITNIMLVTVTERTREIGIRKAIGAPRRAVLGQFLAEATVLSLVGGLLGVALGVVGSQFTIVGVDPVVVPESIALALGVSVGIGLLFGGLPAGRAAGLRPIEALRHE
ncbi:putative ABC transport system permease protein [Thermomonospora echinospora]|uniref:Putative ABC transport system permease protein n=1 Tax=Thermomonospora echinospora TaxID=1992 RepID=A0A1H6C9Y5_9ACTN|nr:ABC transporter permease [Thermomonospora echinospora]SEG69435.1 putative ABC transport system permease protein [Thermomonospora echinospora]